MFLLGALLVGCSSTNDFSDDKVKTIKKSRSGRRAKGAK